MKTVVISLGGSILIPALEKNKIKEYVPVLEEIAAHHRLFVVVGGGGEARRYITVARNLGIDEGTSDEIGILDHPVERNPAHCCAGRPGVPESGREPCRGKEVCRIQKDRRDGRDYTRPDNGCGGGGSR